MLNNNGPKMEPWNIPQNILSQSLKEAPQSYNSIFQIVVNESYAVTFFSKMLIFQLWDHVADSHMP